MLNPYSNPSEAVRPSKTASRPRRAPAALLLFNINQTVLLCPSGPRKSIHDRYEVRGSSVESAKAIQRVASIVRDHIGPHRLSLFPPWEKPPTAAHNRPSFRGGQLAGRRPGTARLRQFPPTEAAHLARGAEAIRLDRDICALFDELDRVLEGVAESASLTPRLSDAVLSFGERLSSLIVTAGFRQAGIDAVHLDARDAIVTDGRHTQAAPLFIETNALLRRKVSSEQVTVMGGFIGATEDGVTTTLGRGGSDYTAAIVGAALAADEIQIWTDVDGMLTCDPRVVSGAHCLRSVSFAEAEQMAKSGAKVLHPATVLPAVRQGIPIVIRNSRNPGAAGTRIVGRVPATAPYVDCLPDGDRSAADGAAKHARDRRLRFRDLGRVSAGGHPV